MAATETEQAGLEVGMVYSEWHIASLFDASGRFDPTEHIASRMHFGMVVGDPAEFEMAITWGP